MHPLKKRRSPSLATFLIGAALLTLPGLAAADHDEPGVTLYRDVAFRGPSQHYTADVASFSGRAIGNDTASSLRLDPGCRVTLYKDTNFRGSAFTVDEDQGDLGRTPVGNDSLSSMRVECRPPGRFDFPRSDGRRPGQYRGDSDNRPGQYDGDRDARGRYRGVTLYADTGFRGRAEVFSGDDPDLRDNTVRQDSASSIRVDPGCRAVLYADTDFRGNSAVVTEDTVELGKTGVGNDRVSSIEVICDRRREGGVTLFEHTRYEGRSETFLEDDPRLNDNWIGKDRVSSLTISPGCLVTLYEHPDFGGRSTILREDVPDLRRTSVGNDTVSSLKIECRRFRRGRD